MAGEQPAEGPRWGSAEIMELLDTLDGMQVGPAAEARKFPRLTCRHTAVFVSVSGQAVAAPSHLVQVRNIARGGVCFLDRTSFPMGTRCRLDIRVSRTEWLKCQGQVVRSRPVAPDVSEMAIMFDAQISEADVQKVTKVITP